MSINIQIHGVISAKWDKETHPEMPRILRITTHEGEQAISLFPSRPKSAMSPPPKNEVEPSPPPLVA